MMIRVMMMRIMNIMMNIRMALTMRMILMMMRRITIAIARQIFKLGASYFVW